MPVIKDVKHMGEDNLAEQLPAMSVVMGGVSVDSVMLIISPFR